MSNSSKNNVYKLVYVAATVVLIASSLVMFANRDMIYFHNIVEAYIAQEPPYIICRKLIYTICMIIVISSSYLGGIVLLMLGMREHRKSK